MKKPKTPRLLTIAITTTVTIIFWTFYSLYSTLVQTPEINVDETLLDPLDPTLDVNELESIQARVFFNQGETDGFIVSDASQETIQLSQTPTPFIDEAQEEVEEEVEEVETEDIIDEPPTE